MHDSCIHNNVCNIYIFILNQGFNLYALEEFCVTKKQYFSAIILVLTNLISLRWSNQIQKMQYIYTCPCKKSVTRQSKALLLITANESSPFMSHPHHKLLLLGRNSFQILQENCALLIS